MGLIGGILQPVHGGFPVTLMSPLGFLRDPLRWLRAVSEEHATTSGGPNFAYDLCIRKTTPEQRARLDLSSWTVAFTCAEPVRGDTLACFAEAFAPAGFRPEAFFPCYGLAEATLMVTGGWSHEAVTVADFAASDIELGRARVARSGERVTRLVACGDAAADQCVTITDPETGALLPPGTVGEIRVAGPSVAAGYWKDPEAEQAAFVAEPDGAQRRLRTGDLGFLREGKLFVAGRIKDLIIIHGRNHAPEDIEATVAACHPALRPGCGAALQLTSDGEDVLGIAHEIRAGHAAHPAEVREIASAIRSAVARDHGVAVHTVALLAQGALPKTSSGKVQRGECRRALEVDALSGEKLDPVSAQALDQLKSWNDNLDGSSAAAAIWLRFLVFYGYDVWHPLWASHKVPAPPRDVFTPRTSDSTYAVDDLQGLLINLTTRDPGNALFSTPQAHRTAPQVIRQAFGQAVADLRKARGDNVSTWLFGNKHYVMIASLLGKSYLDEGPYHFGNNGRTINSIVSAAPERDGKVLTGVAVGGASFRMVVDWGTGRMVAGYPGGQSEDPASPWYADGIAAWMVGDSKPVLEGTQALTATKGRTWTLTR